MFTIEAMQNNEHSFCFLFSVTNRQTASYKYCICKKVCGISTFVLILSCMSLFQDTVTAKCNALTGNYNAFLFLLSIFFSFLFFEETIKAGRRGHDRL